MKTKERRCIIASLFFVLLFMCLPVNASSNYGLIEDRINQNNKVLNDSNSMNEIYRESFTDLDMKEFRETNYKGFDASQQEKLKNIANTILENNGNNLTDSEKLEKFYSFIVDNFYYYQTPEKIPALSTDNKWNNPYYLLTSEYYLNGKVRAKSNGYATTLVMLARTQNIPARLVGGYYNKEARETALDWGSDITNKSVNHVWALVYVDNSWKMFDPVADSYKDYNDETEEYIDNTVSNYENKYFHPTTEYISNTHIAFDTYQGSNNVKYISNVGERNKLLAFLNAKYYGEINGKRINSLYNKNDSSTWFTRNDNSSLTTGYGKIKRIYWPSNKGLSGNLELKYFSNLETLVASKNNLKQLNLIGNQSLRETNVSNNKMTRIVVRGANNFTYLKSENNPAKYIEYEYTAKKRKAIVKAENGGTVSVDYLKRNGDYKHYLKAKADNGYTFVGWYSGKKRVSTKANYTVNTWKPFTYVAKFKKKPPKAYIKISISKQKLYFYKKGNVVHSTTIVTGQRYEHDTPTGTFKIRGKARNIYLVGDDYKNFVHYWMPIYADIGLHDASWRSSFGRNIYKYNGSHGCINLPYKTAKYIYNNAAVGTTVKVVK